MITLEVYPQHGRGLAREREDCISVVESETRTILDKDQAPHSG